MSKVYNFILAGCGSMSSKWLEALSSNPRTRLLGVVDIRQEAADAASKKMSEKFNTPGIPAGTDLRTMIKDLKPDAVIDVTIPSAHKDVVLTAVENGCHILGEKPMSDTLDNARLMADAAQKSGSIYMVSQNYRWNPSIRSIRAAIARGVIGKPTIVNCDFYIGAHFGGFREEMPNPLVVDMSIHHFDMMRCMTQASPEAVYAHAYNPAGSWYKGDAAVTVIFEMSEGIIFNYRGSWCAEGHNTPWNGNWRIIGDKGSIMLVDDQLSAAELAVPLSDAFPKSLFIRPKEKIELEAVPAGLGGQKESLERFVKAMDTGEQPETWCGDNLKSFAMVCGAVESAAKKQRVTLRN